MLFQKISIHLQFKRSNIVRMVKTKVKTKDENTGAGISESLGDSVYINPLTDFGFKRLFYNKELLISFLNDVVGTDIKDIVYRPTEGMGWFYEERTEIFDLLCTTQNDEFVVVEMQLGRQTHFRHRNCDHPLLSSGKV